jgi:hypothetical protein
MLVSRVLLSVSFELLFLLDAVFKDIFVNGINLTCHCALIGCDLVRLEQNTVSWYFHALVDLNNVTYQHKILMHFHQLAISYH